MLPSTFPKRSRPGPGRSGVEWPALVLTLLFLSSASGARAQIPDPILLEGDPIPRVTVTSDPSGAVVTLSGDYEWTGRTPWNLSRPVVGLYKIEASLPGHETWRGEVILGPGGVEDLEIDLSRKTRFKAAMRSLLIPGWGQHYAGSSTKGTLLALGTAAAGITSIFLYESYQNDVDAFEEAAEDYRGAGNIDELSELRRILRERSRDADRSYDRYRLAISAAVGFYALSIVDALFFFPDTRVPGMLQSSDRGPSEETESDLGWSLDVAPGLDRSTVGLQVRW